MRSIVSATLPVDLSGLFAHLVIKWCLLFPSCMSFFIGMGTGHLTTRCFGSSCSFFTFGVFLVAGFFSTVHASSFTVLLGGSFGALVPLPLRVLVFPFSVLGFLSWTVSSPQFPVVALSFNAAGTFFDWTFLQFFGIYFRMTRLSASALTWIHSWVIYLLHMILLFFPISSHLPGQPLTLLGLLSTCLNVGISLLPFGHQGTFFAGLHSWVPS
jgi:hypothetical protein